MLWLANRAAPSCRRGSVHLSLLGASSRCHDGGVTSCHFFLLFLGLLLGLPLQGHSLGDTDLGGLAGGSGAGGDAAGPGVVSSPCRMLEGNSSSRSEGSVGQSRFWGPCEGVGTAGGLQHGCRIVPTVEARALRERDMDCTPRDRAARCLLDLQ